MFHIALHFIVPLAVAGAFYRHRLFHSWVVMMATMLVDLDHLLADPVYDPLRCSIGFHPLHGVFPIGVYVAMCFVPRLHLLGIGLVLHMLLDAADCIW